MQSESPQATVASHSVGLANLRQSLSPLRDALAVYSADSVRAISLARDPGSLVTDLRMPPRLDVLTRFFVLHERVEHARLTGALSEATLETLIALELAVCADGYVSLRQKRLVCHFGLLLFVDTDPASLNAYYGEDSLTLGRLVIASRGRVLDYCAGVGPQSLLAALTAETVTAVEPRHELETSFWINAVLNGVDANVQFRSIDPLTNLPETGFDAVYCEVPSVPIPQDVPYPMGQEGRPNAVAVTARLLSELPRLLAPGGRCVAVGEALGDEEGPDLLVVQQISSELGLSTIVYVTSQGLLEGPTGIAAQLAAVSARSSGDPFASAYTTVLSEYDKTGATHAYSYVLASHIGDGSFAVVSLC